MSSHKDVLVIGGGIIGLSVAVQLAEKGVHTRVIDKGAIGHGCSYGNAGWITPCFAMPLPMPGMIFKSFKWLLNPDSPLYIKPSLDPHLLKWLTGFLLSATPKKAQSGIEALVQLSIASHRLYEGLAGEFPEIEWHQRGLLMVAQTKAGVRTALDELNYVAPHGVPGRSMSGDEIKAFEPALRGPIAGGVYFPNEAHAEPLKVVQALARKAKVLGVQISEQIEVQEWVTESSRIREIQTNQGTLSADTFVLATGSWSKELARKLSLSVPILGGKGYSLIVPPLDPQPRHPIMLIEKKIAITPRAESLRIAGTLELVDQDFSITERRVKAIEKGAREFLNLPDPLAIQEVWRGLRPCTPDGLPLIGYTGRFSNLFLACGHQMLGLQSGLGTGQLAADLITKGSSELDRRLYSPDRFV